jgi:hypothetical protein
MVEFRYMHGAVYIFENSEVQRVKVGMTIMTTSNVVTRLKDVNDKWIEKKVTCQICGGRRFINFDGLIPHHVISGKNCLGGNALPLEKDVTIAESYLEKMKNRLGDVFGSEKGSVTRIVNNLEKRIKKYRHHSRPVGEWQFRAIFYTECAEQVELLSHKILEEHLDKLAPFGEVFCCSVSVAIEAVEIALSQLGLLNSAKKETEL